MNNSNLSTGFIPICKRSFRYRGFTLVELLVVIAIIALLLSILMPALSGAREQAKAAVCMNNIKTLNTCNQIYLTEFNDAYIPFCTTPGGYARWFQLPYVRELLDPGKEVDTSTNDLTISQKLQCPTVNLKKGVYETTYDRVDISYGYNWSGLNVNNTYSSFDENFRGGYIGFKLSDVRRPAYCFAFADSTDFGLVYGNANYRKFWDVYGDVWGSSSSSGSPWNAPAHRHREGLNMGFFDGHCEYLEKEDTFKFLDGGRVDAKANDIMWFPSHLQW